MLSKIDHPQFHPTRVTTRIGPRGVKSPKAGHEKQEWRGGAKVRKK